MKIVIQCEWELNLGGGIKIRQGEFFQVEKGMSKCLASRGYSPTLFPPSLGKILYFFLRLLEIPCPQLCLSPQLVFLWNSPKDPLLCLHFSSRKINLRQIQECELSFKQGIRQIQECELSFKQGKAGSNYRQVDRQLFLHKFHISEP